MLATSRSRIDAVAEVLHGAMAKDADVARRRLEHTGDALRAPLDVSVAASAMADESATAGGGCSTSSEPTSGAVEQALGFISALAMVLRARKRRPPRDDA